MEYFFIAGNVASLVSLMGLLLQVSHILSDNSVARITLGICVLLTLGFWLFFYFVPANRVKKTVRDRLDFAGSYRDSSNDRVELFESEFILCNFSTLTVPLPPFETEPIVTIFSVEPVNAERPSVSNTTLDSFEVRATSTSQWRTWKFRARGRQLLPIVGRK